MTVNQRVSGSSPEGGAERPLKDGLFCYVLYLYHLLRNFRFIYVGHTDDFIRRLTELNGAENNSFTSKHRPWVLAVVFKFGKTGSDPMEIEQSIKRQKSRKLIELLCRVILLQPESWLS
jgi:putative endonuclease